MKELFSRANRFFLIPALLWMAVIFFFSAMTDDVSSEQSDYVSLRLQQLIISRFEGGEEDEMEDWQEDWAETLSLMSVRKPAHVFEYTVLCLLLYVFLCGAKHSRRWSLFLSIAYAISDEFHQIFVPGREGTFVDVGIDSLGAILGFVLTLLFGKAILNLKWRCQKHMETINS